MNAPPRKATWMVLIYGPAGILGVNVVLQLLDRDWLDAAIYALGIACMIVILRQIRHHFRMGYSRGYLDRIVDEATPPADRRPIGHVPEPWDVMFGPMPPMPGVRRTPDE